MSVALWAAAAEADTLTRTSTFSYDPNSGLMTQSVVEPADANFRVQSDFGYDAFGNQTSTTVSGGNIVTRTSGAGYEVKGRFPSTLTNALNQQTTQGFSAAFGDLTSVTDPNLVVSTATYDTWGRKTLVVNGDGTRVSFQYQFCSGVNGGTAACPANGAYRIVQTPLAANGTTQIAQVVATYFDRLERQIAIDNQGLNGEAIRTATEYDALGRVQRTSRPYFLSGGAPRWTTFTYDALDRVTLETRPDASTVGHAYHGLSVTDTNQLGQTQTTLKNSRGEIVSVTDNLGQATSFAYDPFGNLKTTTDSLGHVIGNTYDKYGRKIAMSDPDMGNWSYGYDVLGQLTSQTNARSQTVTLAYDKLGRLTGRTEPDLASTWVYDTQAKGIGKLASTSTTAGFQRSISYDSISRPIQSSVTVDGGTYATVSTYDTGGRIGGVTYPSGLAVAYTYNAIGYLTQISGGAPSTAFWTANAYDAESHLTQATFGNGVVTSKVYNPDTGRIAAIQAGAGNAVQNLGFAFNTLGNLTQRVDAATQTTDALSYDGLNRLTQAVTSNPGLPLNVTKTVGYDAIGNIVNKSDVGNYTYDPARVHAVASIAPGATGTVTASYAYDGNGNMLTGRGRTVAWTSFDMVSQIAQGANTLGFAYDSEHARLKQASSDGSTKYYLNDPVSGIMAEKMIGASLSVTWNDYIMLGAEMVALRVTAATTQTRYFHKDHLGSIVALTDESGAVVERDSFDAWGQRRTPMGGDDPLYPALSLTSQITRGFTGHEQLDAVGLVHMNGRIYEPVIGKMMSPDPSVPNPIDGQAYNRYSYVGNNPLSLTDPTGFRPDLDQRNERGQIDTHRDDAHARSKDSDTSGGDVDGGLSDASSGRPSPTSNSPTEVQLAGPVDDRFPRPGSGFSIPNSRYPGDVTREIAAQRAAAKAVLATNPARLPAGPTTPKPTPNQIGAEGEMSVRATTNIGGKVTVEINGRTRRPDGLIPGESISEVKNVKSLSNTRQLRDFLDLAKQRGLRMDLYTRRDTTLSRPLRDLIDRALINQKFIE